MFDIILFDLDGTLTDSAEGILNSVKYALNKMNIQIPDVKTLNEFIGPPLTDSYIKYCGMTEKEAYEGLMLYREYFNVKGLFENRVYDGIPELLEKLCRDGKMLLVATSKPEEFSIKILEHFGLAKYFKMIVGATLDESINTKDAVINYALERLAKEGVHVDKTKVLMIGDRRHDVEGAIKNGLRCMGVLYGYGSEKELTDAGASYIAATPEEIYDIVSKIA